MKILAFDTTAKIASVAVHDDERMLALYSIDNGLTQSELLLPMAEDMLRSLHLSFDDIDLYATSVGPGSFTGVRIGAALVKGLAFGKGTPCVGVSTLDELAQSLFPLEGIICPCMDARRDQAYNALYSCRNGELTKLTADRAISYGELAAELAVYAGEKIYICGDGYEIAISELSRLGVALAQTPRLLIGQNASSVALVAYEKYRRGEYSFDIEIAPTYLRMPQAERERLERLKQNERSE